MASFIYINHSIASLWLLGSTLNSNFAQLINIWAHSFELAWSTCFRKSLTS